MKHHCVQTEGNSTLVSHEDNQERDIEIETNADNPNAVKEETRPQGASIRKSARSNKGFPAKCLPYVAM